MTPIDVHMRVIALLRTEPSIARGKLIAQGVAYHDGDVVELRTVHNDEVLCVLPDDLVEEALPVMGALRRWYPDADFYVVCGDRVLPGRVNAT